jgi:assimilatory nitrate reductase catalytic subunit
MHWTGQFAASGRVNTLVAGKVDPQSGQPALKMGQVIAAPARVAAYGFVVSRDKPSTGDCLYWATAPAPGGHRTELAWDDAPDWAAEARRLFDLAPDTPLVTMRDDRGGRQSLALFDGDRLVFALFVSPEPVLVSRQWAVGRLADTIDTPLKRTQVLSGRPGADMPDSGPIVCACFSVGAGHGTVEDIGRVLRAGTNCGSCRSEIAALLAKSTA